MFDDLGLWCIMENNSVYENWVKINVYGSSFVRDTMIVGLCLLSKSLDIRDDNTTVSIKYMNTVWTKYEQNIVFTV